jgi:hypothetical protein
MNIDKAMMNPAEVFSHPDQVTKNENLTREQKQKILLRWEYDARELEVAEEENMVGGPPSLLREIHNALLELQSDDGAVPLPVTKLGGH